MGYVTPDYPNQVWDGNTPNKDRRDRAQNLDPNQDDWDQIVAETIATQERVNTLSETAIQFSATNDQGSAITRCQVTYAKPNGKAALASAGATATATILGLVADASINDGAEGQFQSAGDFAATTDEWDVVTGQSGGLTARSRYYLAVTPGRLTRTPSQAVGAIVAFVGVALTTTTLVLDTQTPIRC